MKKTLLIILVAFLCFSSGVLASGIYREFTAKETDYIIEVDEKIQSYDLPIVSIENNAYVPLRQFCENNGYNVNWVENERKISVTTAENELPFWEDITKSKEGVLQDGVAYGYIYEDDFSSQEFLDKHPFTQIYSKYGKVPTAEMAADIGRVCMGYNGIDADATMVVYYDADIDAWLVYGVYPGTFHSGMQTMRIRRTDGRIIDMYEIR